MPKVSVIVPIYNTEQYLPRCIDSILAQTFTDFELILVNDGSTDNSGKICDEYKSKYPKTIDIHKENGGLSDARNAGIEIAQGEYIYFIDSDDWLTPNAISTLLDFSQKNNCGIVQGGFYYAYDDYLLYDNRKIEISQTPFVLGRTDAMQELIKNEYIKNFAWGKLYKTSIVKKYPFPKGKYFEDSYWQHLVVNETTNYGVIPTPLYYYRQRESSISGKFDIKSLDLLKGYEERLNFISIYYPNLTNIMACQFWEILSNMLLVSKKSDYYITYKRYWVYINNKYQDEFKCAFKFKPKYLYGRNSIVVIQVYNLIQKVYNRLFSKGLLKISCNGRKL